MPDVTEPVVYLGDADQLLRSVPELDRLIRSLRWLVTASYPGRAIRYADTVITGSAKPVDEGAATRKYRTRLRHTRREIARISERIDRMLDDEADSSPAPTTGTCANRECDSYGKRLRYGARFCDRCGTQTTTD